MVQVLPLISKIVNVLTIGQDLHVLTLCAMVLVVWVMRVQETVNASGIITVHVKRDTMERNASFGIVQLHV